MNEENETPSDAGNDQDPILPPIETQEPPAPAAPPLPPAPKVEPRPEPAKHPDQPKWDGSFNDVNRRGAHRPFVILKNGEKCPLTQELIDRVSNYDQRTGRPNDDLVEEHVRIERFKYSLIQWEAGETSF